MSRNSSVSFPIVWSNERSCFSASEGPWSSSCFCLWKYSTQVQMGKWRLVLGWDHLFTPDACRRIVGGQQRYLPMIANKPWFEETEKEKQKISTGPLADLVVSSPGCECTLKNWWCYDRVVCHLSLAPRQGAWGSHIKTPHMCGENETFGKTASSKEGITFGLTLNKTKKLRQKEAVFRSMFARCPILKLFYAFKTCLHLQLHSL